MRIRQIRSGAKERASSAPERTGALRRLSRPALGSPDERLTRRASTGSSCGGVQDQQIQQKQLPHPMALPKPAILPPPRTMIKVGHAVRPSPESGPPEQAPAADGVNACWSAHETSQLETESAVEHGSNAQTTSLPSGRPDDALIHEGVAIRDGGDTLGSDLPHSQTPHLATDCRSSSAFHAATQASRMSTRTASALEELTVELVQEGELDHVVPGGISEAHVDEDVIQPQPYHRGRAHSTRRGAARSLSSKDLDVIAELQPLHRNPSRIRI
jgi:hypothetical protein